MKKIAIAAAIAAAVFGAQAQTAPSVQIYGTVDAALSRDSGESQVRSGGLRTNRLGFRGTEDLGNGLSARFQLEQGFRIDDGTQGESGTQFNRQSWVGLAHKSYGEVRLGRTWSSFDDFASEFNQLDDMNIGSGRVGDSYIDSVSNQVKYISPTVAGFQGSIGFSGNEGVAANTKVTSAQATWRHGTHIAVGVAVQDEKSNTDNERHHAVGAKWDLGVARLTGTLVETQRASGNTQKAQAGVAVPMGKLTLHGGLTAAQTRSKDEEVRAFSLLATYDMSKRTALYAGYRSISTETKGVDSDAKRTVVGVRHTF